MSNVRRWGLPALLIADVVLVEDLRLAWNNMIWETKYGFHTTDITQLMDQYANHRMNTGEWPDAKQPYGAFFRLWETEPTASGRMDTFVDSSLSPRRPTWLRFELRDDGHIFARVLDEHPAKNSN